MVDLTKDQQPCPRCGKIIDVMVEFHNDKMCWGIFYRKLIKAARRHWPIHREEQRDAAHIWRLTTIHEISRPPEWVEKGERPKVDGCTCEEESVWMRLLRLDVNLQVVAGYSAKLNTLIFDRDFRLYPAYYEQRR